MELKKNLVERISTIEKYLPYTVDIVKTVDVLKKMGCSDRDITKIISEGEGYTWHKIINPETAQEYITSSARIKLVVKQNKSVEILIDEKTIPEYFSDLDAFNTKIKKLCVKSGDTATKVYKENLALKEDIASLVERNKMLEQTIQMQDTVLLKMKEKH